VTVSPLSRAMTEDQLLDAIRSYARLMGWLTYHVHDSRRSEPGFPDLVCIRGNTAWALELKTEKGRITEDQELWISAINQVENIQAMVIRPSQLDEIIRLMR